MSREEAGRRQTGSECPNCYGLLTVADREYEDGDRLELACEECGKEYAGVYDEDADGGFGFMLYAGSP